MEFIRKKAFGSSFGNHTFWFGTHLELIRKMVPILRMNIRKLRMQFSECFIWKLRMGFGTSTHGLLDLSNYTTRSTQVSILCANNYNYEYHVE